MEHEEGIDTVYGKVCLRKERKQRRKLLVGEQLQDFARNTTLHGLRYVAERGVTIVEKIFWLLLFLVSVGVCLYQIRNVWIKWDNSPVIVSINERLVPVSEVPFPSVTICPQRKVSKEYNYGEEKEKMRENITQISYDNRKKFEDVSLICNEDSIFEELSTMWLDRNYSDSKLVEHIEEAMGWHYLMLNLFSECKWRHHSFSCFEILNRVYTEEGICFNFNALAAEDLFRTKQMQSNYNYIESNNPLNKWSMDGGYEGDSFNDTYPRRGRQNGAQPDLVILFIEDRSELDTECNALYSGYKVYVQHPADMPQSSLYYYAMLPEQTSSFALKYSVVATSDEVKDYTPEIRHCYFPGERYLRYFQIYTENNCRLECLSNYTYKICGCVGFYMPHNTSDRICTVQSKHCMESVIENIAETETAGISSRLCNCLPACNTVEYDAEILKTKFNIKRYLMSQKGEDLFWENYTFSRLEMYFKSPRFVSMRRSELFGLTDFIANCGGLLGLFLGFSFLSLVEIIYFMTLRLWCTFKRDLDEEKQKKVEYKRN